MLRGFFLVILVVGYFLPRIALADSVGPPTIEKLLSEAGTIVEQDSAAGAVR
jgi:hypothetical protein